MTSGPMPSPASTAMWSALLADMKLPQEDRMEDYCRHGSLLPDTYVSING
jgi:hypothetical protein